MIATNGWNDVTTSKPPHDKEVLVSDGEHFTVAMWWKEFGKWKLSTNLFIIYVYSDDGEDMVELCDNILYWAEIPKLGELT